MKLQFEENEYYLMKDGEDLAIATTDESFIKELGAERLSVENCDAIYYEAINYGYDLGIEVEIEMDFYFPNLPKRGEHKPVVKPKLDEDGCLILKRK